MNLLKKFIRETDLDRPDTDIGDYNDLYIEPDGLSETDIEEEVASLDSPARKDPEFHPASADKVSIKLLQPKSHIEATKIADKLKDGCIVLLDISNLTKEQAHRLVDFLAGVAYVLGGEMIKTNKNTIVVSPSGVDISGFAQEEVSVEEPVEDAVIEEEYEEIDNGADMETEYEL